MTTLSRLHTLVHLSGLRPQSLSRLADLAPSHLHTILVGGVAQPQLGTLRALASVTGVELAWLALGDGKRPARAVVRAAVKAAQAAARERVAAAGAP